MKTTYWLVTAAAVAAVGVIVYARSAADVPPLPKMAPIAEEQSATSVLALPPVVLPPDEPLVLPEVPVTGAVPPPPPPAEPSGAQIVLASATQPILPSFPVPTLPTMPAYPAPVTVDPPVEPQVPPAPNPPESLPLPNEPLTPPAPTQPLEPPAPKPAMPAAPVMPDTTPAPPAPIVAPVAPAMPETPPVAPIARPVAPVAPIAPAMPTTSVVPAVPTPSLLPPPASTPPLPQPAPVIQPPVLAKPDANEMRTTEPLAVAGRYVVLKDNKLIEGDVSVGGDIVIVLQGALNRKFSKGQVQFVGGSRDEVYQFMLAKESATDAAARLRVARWCMFNGLREQALTEAREVQKVLQAQKLQAKLKTEAELKAEMALVRSAADLVRSLELSLQQFPIEGAVKMVAPAVPTFPTELAPVRPTPPTPPAQLDPEPDVSPEAALVFGARVQPFLANQCIECHAKPDHAGKFKLVRVDPNDAGPQATRTNLRAVAGQLRKDDPAISPLLWKSLTAHGGMKLPAIVSRQAVAYQALEAWTALAVGTPPAVPPVPVPAPAVPPAPVPPQADPPVLPAPVIQPPMPSVPPIPPADPLTPSPVPPPIPPIPPAAAAPSPAPVGGTQFGTTLPPKSPATGPTGGDEFDPAGFNQQPKK